MNHNGLLFGAVAVNVLKLKVMRELEVKLNGTALPRAAQAIRKMEVNLGSIERAITLVEHIVDAHGLKRIL